MRGIASNSDDAGIGAAVISMGNHLHMRVIAEGVKTQAQLAFLQDNQCRFGQGYYFSQLVAAWEFTLIAVEGR